MTDLLVRFHLEIPRSRDGYAVRGPGTFRCMEQTKARVCPNCAMVVRKPVDRCPRCRARMAMEHDDNVVDKAGADSFPASDPPQH